MEESDDGVRRIGSAWLRRRDGILCMYLAGPPFALGYCHAVLTDDYGRKQEDEFIRLVQELVPSSAARWALKKLVLLRNRDLSSHIQHRYKLELCGLARGSTDHHPELGPLYNRLLNYHAAHDLAHAYMDSALVGCTAFAAWGEATQDGHLLIGRNFDFNAPRSFDRNKIVMRVEPQEGLGFIAVGWAGMIGVVTGINDARIAVTINASHSTDKRRTGTPASLVLRDVRESASTLDEAVDIIRRSEVFVSDCYLVADGKSGKAVVVEKTPSRSAVRSPAGDYLICTNHFLTEALKADEANVGYMRDGTSVTRYERVETLLTARTRPLTPADVAAVLRDRTVPGVASPVLGHPAAINSLVATHSVVIDATAGIIWASGYPHQLGMYVPFGPSSFGEPNDVAAIAADPLLADGGYERFQEADGRLSEGERLADGGELQGAAAALLEAAALNPQLYRPYLVLGEIALRQENWTEAEGFCREAQSLYPAFRSERESIRRMLERVEEVETGSQR